MKRSALTVLRLGLGVTFLAIGIMIYLHPSVWASSMQPWARHLMPGSLAPWMTACSAFSTIVGLLFIVNLWVWVAALIAAIHLVIMLVMSGITDVTVLNLGLLAATVSLFLAKKPENLFRK